jgi:hypothetical protein
VMYMSILQHGGQVIHVTCVCCPTLPLGTSPHTCLHMEAYQGVCTSLSYLTSAIQEAMLYVKHHVYTPLGCKLLELGVGQV